MKRDSLQAGLATRLAGALALLRGVRVHALVGPSGTGKSFRARLIAERNRIDLIIDDGLLIQRGSILGGHWAKKERTLLGATRRALFDGPGEAQRARAILREARPRRVLIVGTSEEMARRIARTLGLPAPARLHRVEDIASRQEIERALRARKRVGGHSLPVPAVDIRRSALRELAVRVRQTLAPLAGPSREPKVLSEESARGRVFYTEAAVAQLVMHCALDFDAGIRVRKVSVRSRQGWLAVEVTAGVPHALNSPARLHELRDSLAGCLERHAGLPVRELSLVVEEVESPGRRAPGGQ